MAAVRGGLSALRSHKRLVVAAAAALAAAGAVAAALALGGDDTPPAPALADAVPFDGRSPREPSGERTRVIVALPRPALGAAGISEPGAQRAYVRSLEQESAALRSALGARGIRLSDVITFARTFNGFAATVRTSDLADLPSLGVRAQPVRRFYPASSEPAYVPGLRLPVAAAPLGGAPVAVLDSGVDRNHPLLADGLDPGFDAVDRDRDPAPARDPRGGRRETSGTALAGILVAAGERVLPIRVAGLQPAPQGAGLEDVAGSDRLLAGLERAVDPDADGATDDHVAVALVGVNSPYAAFERSPEARAVRAAAALGMLVVAPAGGEGAAAGPQGTIGSPAAAPDALAVGALAAPAAVARLELRVGGVDARGAVLLAGDPPPGGLRTAGPVEATDPAALLVHGAGSLRGRLAVVRAGDQPVARAAAAAAAGARAVLLAEPRRRPLPAVPAGRIAAPVLGVTGDTAATVLDEDAGALVEVGDVTPGRPPAALPVARGALRAALIAAAAPDPRLPARGSGAGALRRPASPAALTARTTPARRADPCPGEVACVRIVLSNRGGSAATPALSVVADPQTSAALARSSLTIPAGGRREAVVEVTAAGPDGLAAGRLVVRAGDAGAVLTHPFMIAIAPREPPPLGALTLQRDGGRVSGVRFSLGAFERGDPLDGGARITLTERVALTLVKVADDRVVRRLTPPGGARELLPAEYAYELPAEALRALGRGRYAFRAVAGSPAGGAPATARSEPFER